MVAEVLGKLVCKLAALGDLKGIQLATALSLEVIQQFLDDTFLFGESSIQETRAWRNLHTNYEDYSGQQINLVKSKV